MAHPNESSTQTVQPSWPTLNVHERRVLGVLVEKAKTTPDVYPLSINAIVTASNQKSNRDPVLNLSEDDVEEALTSLQTKGLTIKITGGRVIRWRHALYEAWRVDKVELAILAELLLRGPQTEGELRGRASRMEPIDDLDRLRSVLQRLAERQLIVYLSPQGKRGTTVSHNFDEPHERAQRVERAPETIASSRESVSVTSPPAERQVAHSSPPQSNRPGADPIDLAAELNQLRAQVSALRDEVAQLKADVQFLKSAPSEQAREFPL